MYCCCSLTRTPRAIPLICRVSRRSSYSPIVNPLYSSYRYNRASSPTRATTTSFGAMFFSSADGGRERGHSQLPSITSYKERSKKKNKDKRRNPSSSSSSSSWDDSATRFFSRTMEQEEDDNSTSNKEYINDNGGREASTLHHHHHLQKRREGRRKELEKRTKDVTTTPLSSLRQGSTKEKREGWSTSRAADNHEYRRTSSPAQEDRREEEEEDADTPRWYRDSRLERPEVRRRWDKPVDNWGSRKPWKEATDSSVPKMVGQGIYGVGPVLAALTVGRREFYALYIQEGLDFTGNNRKKKDKKGVEKVIKFAERIGLKVTEASKHDLNMVVDNRPHQGLLLDASPLEMVNIRELEPPASAEDCKAPLWVALDEVMDPQNLGAIVRSAYFFGAQGVVLCAKNSAPLSGVVSKASAGSLELIELRSCKNMMQFLSSSVENGWRVLGGSVSSRSLPLSEVESGVPTILVLGSEGTGLRPLVERSCTHLIRIPGNMPVNECPGVTEQEPEEMDQSNSGREHKFFLAVESLNVSVAAGVLLYHLGGNNTPLVDTKPDIAND